MRFGSYLRRWFRNVWRKMMSKLMSKHKNRHPDVMHESRLTAPPSERRYFLAPVSHTEIEPRHEKTCLCHTRTTKVQISLRILAVWSTPLLFAAWIVQYLYYTCCSRNFKTLASLRSWADRFKSILVANSEDGFSRDEAQLLLGMQEKLYYHSRTTMVWHS